MHARKKWDIVRAVWASLKGIMGLRVLGFTFHCIYIYMFYYLCEGERVVWERGRFNILAFIKSTILLWLFVMFYILYVNAYAVGILWLNFGKGEKLFPQFSFVTLSIYLIIFLYSVLLIVIKGSVMSVYDLW